MLAAPTALRTRVTPAFEERSRPAAPPVFALRMELVIAINGLGPAEFQLMLIPPTPDRAAFAVMVLFSITTGATRLSQAAPPVGAGTPVVPSTLLPEIVLLR